MAEYLDRTEIAARGAQLVDPAALRPNRAQRAWDLHPAVHAMIAGAFFAFIGILCGALMAPGLVLPFAVFATLIAAFFAIPAIFGRMAPKQDTPFQSWAEFMREGIDTGSGHLGGREVLFQALTVPAMLVGWSVFVAVCFAATS